MLRKSGPGWCVYGEKPPWLSGTDTPRSAAHFSSPEGGHQMCPLRTPQMAQSRGQALTGTAGLSTRDPQKGAGISMGSPQSLVFSSLWGGVSCFGHCSFRAPCRWGGQPKETKPHGRNSLQPSRLHQPRRFGWLSQSTQTKCLCLPNNPDASSAAQMQDGPLEAEVAL